MNNLDKLQDVLQDEMMIQEMYNRYMLQISNPEVRQMFTQMRDAKMQHVTMLQQQVQQMMQSGRV